MGGKERERGEDVIEISAEELLPWAIRQHQVGNFPDAARAYLAILRTYPTHPGALNLFGVLQHQMGHSEEGLELVRRATEVDPGYADAFNNLGNIHFQLGRREEAAEAYRRVTDLDPRHADALSNLGRVQALRGDLPEAERLYRAAIEADPEHTEAHRNLGNLLLALRRSEEGLTLLRRAVELNPRSAREYEALGRAYRLSDNLPAAIALYREWLSFDPESETAKHHLAACTGDGVPERASAGYVKEQFDHFADSFDEVLERLEYRGPALCQAALAREAGEPDGSLVILDAGCGTGLCGEALRPFARRLVGVDLSKRMLDRARETGHYDELAQADLAVYLGHAGGYDAILAADTFCYFGELEEVFRGAASALRPGGLFVFTVEAAGEGEPDHTIRPHGRYRHRSSYIERVLGDAGFEIQRLEPAVLRKEQGEDVAGTVVTARRLPT